VILTITGAVGKEVKFTMAQLQAMSPVTLNSEHPKNGAQTNTGVRLNALRDVIRAYVKENTLAPTSQVIVTGICQGTKKKSATLTWAEVLDSANHVLYSPSNDGASVKIAATLDRLSTRNDWIQGLTQIDVKTKP
jgi:hypothetical protein